MRALSLTRLAANAATLLAVAATAATAEPARKPIEHATPGFQCDANVIHPLSLRVVTLDPIVHSANVRLRVIASSRVGVERAVLRMVSAGGTTPTSPALISLGSLAPGHEAVGEFALALPAQGSRHYIEFQISGQGPKGLLTRGACFNMLPDGRLEASQLITTPQGVRVLQVAARRIDR